MRTFPDEMRDTDVQGNIYDEIEYYLYRKKQNDENIPREVLETRYKKNYTKMKDNIWSRFLAISKSYCFGSFVFAKEDSHEMQKFANRINGIVEKAKKDGVFAKVQVSLFEQYDLYAALDAVTPIRDESMEYYKEYWYSKCTPCKCPGYPYFNSLIGMWYSEKYNSWVRKSETGMESTSMLLPQ